MPQDIEYPPTDDPFFREDCMLEQVSPGVNLTREEEQDIIDRIFIAFSEEDRNDVKEFFNKYRNGELETPSQAPLARFQVFRKGEPFEFRVQNLLPAKSDAESDIKGCVRRWYLLRLLTGFSLPFLGLFFGLALYSVYGEMDTELTSGASIPQAVGSFFSSQDALSLESDLGGGDFAPVWLVFSSVLLAVALFFGLIHAGQQFDKAEEKVKVILDNWKDRGRTMANNHLIVADGQMKEFIYLSKRLMHLRRHIKRVRKWMTRIVVVSTPLVSALIAVVGWGVFAPILDDVVSTLPNTTHMLFVGCVVLSAFLTFWALDNCRRKLAWLRWYYTTNIDPTPALSYKILQTLDRVYRDVSSGGTG